MIQTIYDSPPNLHNAEFGRQRFMTLEYYLAAPDYIAPKTVDLHYVLVNLKDEPHRVDFWHDGGVSELVFEKNGIVVVPSGVASGWRWYSQSDMILVTVEPSRIETFAQADLGCVLGENQLSLTTRSNDENLASLSRLLLNAVKRNSKAAQVAFDGLERAFLAQLVDRYGDEPVATLAGADTLSAEQLSRVHCFIEENYANSIKIDDLASVAGLSPFYFARLFKRSMGLTPHQFVMKYRIERAQKRMIQRQKVNLARVAVSCGFSDQAHFTKVFRNLVGVTPSVWQKRNWN